MTTPKLLTVEECDALLRWVGRPDVRDAVRMARAMALLAEMAEHTVVRMWQIEDGSWMFHVYGDQHYQATDPVTAIERACGEGGDA